MYQLFFKRVLDFIISLLALIVLAPIFLIVAILVRVKIGKSVIFKQKRPGLNCKIFTLYKFRTMTEEREVNGNLLSDEKRLTKFGKTLRSLSLDELPQFFNVLKGDMSFIGPRPLLVEYLELYTQEQKCRQNVKPGITGLAQVNGRNLITWEDKFRCDLEYVEKMSIKTDFSILISTIKVVLLKKGITQNGSATTTMFEGTEMINETEIGNVG